MGQLQILFEVPRFIEHGLATGTFQRVGGVIVDSSSKQIVAWLRDGSMLEAGFNVVGSAMNPLNTVMKAAQLIDGQLTRKAIGVLGKQIAANHAQTLQVLGSIEHSVNALASLTLGGQLLSLAMTAATFKAIIHRLDRLSDSISQLEQKILDQFHRNRDIRFQRALQVAHDAFESQNDSIRESKALRAEEDLLEARMQFFTDLKRILESDPKDQQLTLAQHILVRAMYAEISRIRCFMMNREHDLAKKRFGEVLPDFEKYAKTLIKLWMGEHNGAIYFHKDVPSEYLARFIYIQQWLRGVPTGNDAFTMFQIIEEFRPYLWDETIFGKKDVRKDVIDTLTRRTSNSRFTEKQLQTLGDNLLQAEILIENYERLIGFEMEIQSMRVSFEEWSRLASDEELEEHGGALIVDDEIAERYARLSM
jgi:hypothetical protein